MEKEIGEGMSERILKNPFGEEGRWYKANLHTHTTASDGKLTPEERVTAYREMGYSILAITDHGSVTDVAELSTEGFLVIPGMEGHPSEGDTPYHIVVLNAPADFIFAEGESALEFVSSAYATGGFPITTHPY